MGIFKYDVYRSPNVGIYTKVNDEFVFVPNGFATTKARNLADFLKTDYIFTSVANTRLLGPLMVVNNQGIILPRTSLEDEVTHLKKNTGLNVAILDTKYTALGNLICVNDKGGIISPIIPGEYVKKIQDILGIEIIQKKIARYHQAGVMAVATSHGGIVHPNTEEDDINAMSEVLGVRLEAATINSGIPYVASGILANNKSLVVGTVTNGPELVMLTRAFKVED